MSAAPLLVPLDVGGLRYPASATVGPGPSGPALFVGSPNESVEAQVWILPLDALGSREGTTTFASPDGDMLGMGLTFIDAQGDRPLLAASTLGGRPTQEVLLFDALAPGEAVGGFLGPPPMTAPVLRLATAPGADGVDRLAVLLAIRAGGGEVFVLEGPWEGVRRLESAAAGVVSRNSDSFCLDFDASTDFDGDGIGDLFLSSSANARPAPSGGAAYLFQGPIDALISTDDADLHLFGEGTADQVGYANTTLPDVEGDGLPDLALGGLLQSPRPVVVFTCAGSLRGTGSVESLCGGRINLPYDRQDFAGATHMQADGAGGLYVAEDMSSESGAVAGRVWWLPDLEEGVTEMAKAGLAIDGEEDRAYLGGLLYLLPDQDGDGIGDLLVGHGDVYGTETAASYLPSSRIAEVAPW